MRALIGCLDLLVNPAVFFSRPAEVICRDLADFNSANAGLEEVDPGDVHHVFAKNALAKIIYVDIDAARDLRLVLVRDEVAENAQRVDQD